MIEYINKFLVILSVNCFQLNRNQVLSLKYFCIKKIWTWIVFHEQILILLFKNRRQLIHITNKNQLHSAKGSLRFSDISERQINCIYHICPNHTYLIYDKGLQLLYQFSFFLVITKVHQQIGLIDGYISIYIFIIWNKGGKWQSKKRMNGDSSGIDSCNTSWRKNYNISLRDLYKVSQKSGLPRTRLACNKHRTICPFYQING